MIVRVSEAHLRVGLQEEFMTLLLNLVANFPQPYPGLLRHEVLIDRADPLRVQYLSVWSDEASLVNYAGERWQSEPVTFPEEDRYLAQPLTLHHFDTVPITT
jgi:quinol monooxygenase YgiN